LIGDADAGLATSNNEINADAAATPII